MWLLIVVIITFGPLYAREIYIYLSCHVLYPVVENPVASDCRVSLTGGTICASISVIGAKALLWR